MAQSYRPQQRHAARLRRDEIPSVRIGKYVRFDLDEVLASLNPRIASARVNRKPMIRRVQK